MQLIVTTLVFDKDGRLQVHTDVRLSESEDKALREAIGEMMNRNPSWRLISEQTLIIPETLYQTQDA